jgi:hypothetical protein
MIENASEKPGGINKIKIWGGFTQFWLLLKFGS